MQGVCSLVFTLEGNHGNYSHGNHSVTWNHSLILSLPFLSYKDQLEIFHSKIQKILRVNSGLCKSFFPLTREFLECLETKERDRRINLKFRLLIGPVSTNFEISYYIQLHEFLLFVLT